MSDSDQVKDGGAGQTVLTARVVYRRINELTLKGTPVKQAVEQSLREFGLASMHDLYLLPTGRSRTGENR